MLYYTKLYSYFGLRDLTTQIPEAIEDEVEFIVALLHIYPPLGSSLATLTRAPYCVLVPLIVLVPHSTRHKSPADVVLPLSMLLSVDSLVFAVLCVLVLVQKRICRNHAAPSWQSPCWYACKSPGRTSSIFSRVCRSSTTYFTRLFSSSLTLFKKAVFRKRHPTLYVYMRSLLH